MSLKIFETIVKVTEACCEMFGWCSYYSLPENYESMAELYLELKEYDKSVECVERASKHAVLCGSHRPWLLGVLKNDTDFDPIRNDERIQKVIAELEKTLMSNSGKAEREKI